MEGILQSLFAGHEVVAPRDVVLRLFAATLLGGLIGLEREKHSQPAGLRTHIVVCVGATLAMIVSLEMSRFSPSADPSRIAAMVVAGIGFLGAGAIMRFGTTVRGLTTAACLWTVSGIGLAVGAGFYAGAILATFLVLLTTFGLDRIEKWLLVEKAYKKLTVTARETPKILGRVEDVLFQHGVEVKSLGIHRMILENRTQVTGVVKVPENVSLDRLSADIAKIAGIEQFEME